MIFIIPLSHGSDDSLDQSTHCVCSLNLLATSQTAWYPNGGALRDKYSYTQLSLAPAHFGRWKREQFHTYSYLTEPHPPVETSH